VSTVIARTVVRTVVPLVLVTAVALLLQGHNLPGGGFIAGVLTAVAFALVYVIFGEDYLLEEVLDGPPAESLDEFEEGLTGGYRTLFGVGLALAAGSGLVPILLGRPFLTQAVVFLEHLPVYGELEVASALAFDVGVYLVVVGGLLTIVSVVGHE
jgi:multicomponent Na+:H+ antiporter subunit B